MRRVYNQLSATIFESAKYPFVIWLQFLELMIWHNPTRAVSEILSISEQTAIEWRHRVFKTVNDYQENLVLSGKVWIDETYLSDWKKTSYSQKKRGLSSQKYCIVVAIDTYKYIFAFVSGKGKPSTKRIKAALEKHIAKGKLSSTIKKGLIKA